MLRSKKLWPIWPQFTDPKVNLMQIAEQKVVTIDYTLTDDQGTVIDQSEGGKFAYLHGARNIIPGLEKALEGKGAGDAVKVEVAPEEGYGPRDDNLQQQVPREMFGEHEPQPGMQFNAQTPDGQTITVTVVKAEGDQVTIDANHPLAGVSLNFDVQVVDVRDATEEEQSHGHVHGADDHDH